MRSVTSGAGRCASRTTAVRAVIAAMLARASATRLEARCAEEKPRESVARVATTPRAPATMAPVPDHNPAPEPLSEAP